MKRRTRSVLAGLRWLAAHQSGTGAWDPTQLDWCNGKRNSKAAVTGKGKKHYAIGVTSMALSAFLLGGYAYDTEHGFRRVIDRGFDWLLKQQDATGSFAKLTHEQGNYDHAFAALALADAYGEYGGTRFASPLRTALDYAVLARQPYGGWRYGIKPSASGGAMTACMLLPFLVVRRTFALRPSEDVGVYAQVVGSIWSARAAITKLVDPNTGQGGYLTRGSGSARPDGQFERWPAEHTEAMTAAALLVLSSTPGGAPRSRDRLLAHEPEWTSPRTVEHFYWYQAALALSMNESRKAVRWRLARAEMILGAQKQGTDPCGLAGSWDPDGPWGGDGGRVYSTAISILTLLAPYRFGELDDGRADLLTAVKNSTPSEAQALELAVLSKAARLIHDGALKTKPAATLLPSVGLLSRSVRLGIAGAYARRKLGASDVALLQALTSDADVGVRVRVAIALLPQRDERAEAARQSMRADADPRVRLLTMVGSAQLADTPPFAQAMSGFFKDDADLEGKTLDQVAESWARTEDDPVLIKAAFALLVEHNPDRALRVAKVLSDPPEENTPWVRRREAVLALGALASRADEATRALLGLAGTKSGSKVGGTARLPLASLWRNARKAFLSACRDCSLPALEWVADAISTASEGNVKGANDLSKMAAATQDPARLEVLIVAMGKIGPKSISKLKSLLKHKERSARIAVAKQLRRMYKSASSALSSLRSALKRADHTTERTAIREAIEAIERWNR